MRPLSRLVSELRQRRVFHAAGVYVASAFVALQAADLLIPALHLPDWTLTLLVMIALFGFPLALVLAWAFEITPEGVRRADPADAAPVPPLRAGVSPRARRRPLAVSLALLGVLVVLVLAGGTLMAIRRPSELVANRVVIAPFENRTGDPVLAPLGSMAADWITQGLVESGFVEVIDAQTALATSRGLDSPSSPGSESANALALARETGAGMVVWGAYYRHGDSIQFQTRVTSAAEARLLRSLPSLAAPVTSPMSAIESLRQRVLASLADLLDPRLASFEPTVSQPPRYEAYRAYTEGLIAYLANDHAGAAQYFDRAVRLDSTFLRAHIWAAQAHGVVAYASGDTTRYFRADSLFAILASARELLGAYDQHHLDFALALRSLDKPAAYRAAQRMLEAAPGSTDAIREAGLMAVRTNRYREAIERLRQLDPDRGMMRGHPDYWDNVLRAYHLLGNHRRELKEARRLRDEDPGNLHRLTLEVKALAALGRIDALEPLFQEAAGHAGSARIVGQPDQLVWNAGQVMRIAALELRTHGHHRESRQVSESALHWHRNRPADESRTPVAREELAEALYLTERWKEARVGYAELAEAPGPVRSRARIRLGTIAARLGDREQALAISATLMGASTSFRTFWTEQQAIGRARIAALLGDRDRAILLLQQARPFFGIDHTDVDLEPLRGDRRFQQMVEPRE